jgi:hypothetical protein
MNHKCLTPEDQKSLLSPFCKGGYESPPLVKGDLGFHAKACSCFWFFYPLNPAAKGCRITLPAYLLKPRNFCFFPFDIKLNKYINDY